jgi:pimeloyl-ACP methyl ester carboxylesterase
MQFTLAHILPNVFAPIIIRCLNQSTKILTGAGLSLPWLGGQRCPESRAAGDLLGTDHGPVSAIMILHVDDLKIYYEALGEGAPLLLLHGWGTDSSSLRSIMLEASQRVLATPSISSEGPGCRAYALDFPGFGFSERPASAWDVGQYARFVAHFLQAVSLPAVDLLGHSFGGRVAIKLAAQRPELVRRLVLVDSAGIRPRRTPAYYFKVGLAKTSRRLGSLAARVLPDNAVSRLAERQGSRDYRQAGAMRQTFVKVVNEDLRDHLPRIQCPTLIIWGELDPETPLADAHQMHRLIPGSRLAVIPKAGHFPFLEKPAEFGQALFPFLGLTRPEPGAG